MLDFIVPRYPVSVNSLTDPEPRKGCSFCGEYVEPGTDWCARHLASEGPEVIRKVGGYSVESFTTPGRTYWVNTCGARPVCNCPAWSRKATCKHCALVAGLFPPRVIAADPQPVATPTRPKIAAAQALDDCFATKAERRVA